MLANQNANASIAYRNCSSPTICSYFAISTSGDVWRENEGGGQRGALHQQFPLTSMGMAPIKTLVTAAFLYSLSNCQHFILLVYVLCPLIPHVVFRFCQRASLCASCILQVNSTVMNLATSTSSVIAWYHSMQSNNRKWENHSAKNLADSNTSWKYRYSTVHSHYQKNTKEKYDSMSSKIAVPTLKTKGLRSVCTLLILVRGNKARSDFPFSLAQR